MKTYWVNFDYELNLFNTKIKDNFLIHSKINQKLEYLFFWLERNQVLITNINYDTDFLNDVFHLTGNRNVLKSKTEKTNRIHFWWGQYDCLEQKRSLNSKETLWRYLFAKKLTHPLSKIITKDQIVETQGMIFKSFFGFSGKGIFPDTVPSFSQEKYFIQEPILKRFLDLSWVNTPRQKGILINYIDEKFQYYGSLFNPEIFQGENYWIRQFSSLIQEVQIDFHFDLDQYWSYDTFLYQENDTCYLHGGCEINYRRTMGGILLDLITLFSLEKYYVMLRLIKGDLLNSDFNKNYPRSFFSVNGGYIKLHPINSTFGSVIIYSKSFGDLEILLDQYGLI